MADFTEFSRIELLRLAATPGPIAALAIAELQRRGVQVVYADPAPADDGDPGDR